GLDRALGRTACVLAVCSGTSDRPGREQLFPLQRGYLFKKLVVQLLAALLVFRQGEFHLCPLEQALKIDPAALPYPLHLLEVEPSEEKARQRGDGRQNNQKDLPAVLELFMAHERGENR